MFKIWPYRRDIRPPLIESLGEHTDREYEKIERAIASIHERLDNILDVNSLVE